MNKEDGIVCLFGENDNDLSQIFEDDEQKSFFFNFLEIFLQNRMSIFNVNKNKRKTRLGKEKNNSREEGECIFI